MPAIAIKADSANPEVRGAVAQTVAHFGRLDILVVNAGILIRGTVDTFHLEDFDRMLATNVRGVFVAIQAAAPHLADGGRIITIGSNTAVRTAFPGGSIYSMTKGAIASLVRGVAIDLAPRGITVNNVQPGPTATDMTGEHGERVKRRLPLGRMGSPEEIAGLVAYLVRPRRFRHRGQPDDRRRLRGVIATAAPCLPRGPLPHSFMKGLTQIGGLRFRVLRMGLRRETGVPTPQNWQTAVEARMVVL